jgi:hypothetical protein
MQNLSYWKQFESTGKVEDYLTYRCSNVGPGWSRSPVNGNETGELGADPYAGIYKCNRNRIETDAYRGI